MKRRKKEEPHRREPPLFEWDANFAYIIGYTSAGFPYGVTWDEWEGPLEVPRRRVTRRARTA